MTPSPSAINAIATSYRSIGKAIGMYTDLLLLLLLLL